LAELAAVLDAVDPPPASARWQAMAAFRNLAHDEPLTLCVDSALTDPTQAAADLDVSPPAAPSPGDPTPGRPAPGDLVPGDPVPGDLTPGGVAAGGVAAGGVAAGGVAAGGGVLGDPTLGRPPLCESTPNGLVPHRPVLGGPNGLRGGQDERLLGFQSGEVRLDVQVDGEGTSRTVHGLAEPACGEVEVCWPDGSVRAELDRIGWFLVAGVPAGPVRLLLHRADQPSYGTDWFVC
jgi:hypothetical protein